MSLSAKPIGGRREGMGRGAEKMVDCGAMRIQPARSDLGQWVFRALGCKGPGPP
jgi:hypothetical protein